MIYESDAFIVEHLEPKNINILYAAEIIEETFAVEEIFAQRSAKRFLSRISCKCQL